MIRYVTHSDIDPAKWDACIKNAANSLLYGHSFYLNAIATRWDAMVLNDYEAVMPLVWRKKWGVRYLYQPAFTQQLGIFSVNPVSSDIAAQFLSAVKKTFQFAEIFINTECGEALPNCVLHLADSYQNIQKNYSNDLIKNLKVAEKQQLGYVKTYPAADAAAMYRHLYAARMPQVTDNDYTGFLNICRHCETGNMLFVRAVTGANDELLAIALFLKDENRIYNVMSSVTDNGRKQSANHWLFDQLIQEFAATGLMLDFEGSVIPGIKKFYENFGAQNQLYYFMRYNNLPLPLRWFKKKSNC